MDAYNIPYAGTQWIHHTPESQQPQDSTSPNVAADEWGKDRAAQGAMDLSDHSFGLGDLQAASSSAQSITPAQAFYHAYSGPTGFFTPYGGLSYSQTQWTQQPPLPLSSYSTLNGATSTVSQPQQQSSPTMPPMMIDPALTVNGGTSNGSQSYSQPSSSSQHSPLQHHHSQQLNSPPMSITPMYVTQQHHLQLLQQQQQQQHQQHQQQQQQQRTLSPSALHGPIMNSIMPSMFYGLSNHTNTTPAAPPVVSEQDRKQQFQDGIRALLAPTALSAAPAVQSIVMKLDDFGAQEVDATMRLEIVTKIRDNAGNPFFRAWAENVYAMDIFREWLKAGATGKDDGQWEETIMPLLHVIDRLPLTIDTLRVSKLGKIIVKLMKEPPTSAIKDMASNIERKWRQMVAAASEGSKKADANGIEDKTKKRKSSDVHAKAAPPAKKAAIGSAVGGSANATARPVAKKETKVVVTAVKDVKSDSSFFSAPKPKPKLPSFKKAPPPMVKKEPDVGIAQPNAFDPFQEALKSMAKNRNASPVVQTPPAAAGTSGSASKPSKKRKFVTWAPDSQLEQIRLIDKAIYDDDPVDGVITTHNIRDLERDEGAAMHKHLLFEEAIDWSEPQLVGIPHDIEVRPRGAESMEKDIQDERERSSLGALYMSPAQIPDSPAEPAQQIPLEEVDANMKPMLAGTDIQPFFSNATSVADLVGQLKSTTDVMGGMDAMIVDQPTGSTPGIDLRGLGLDANALSALTQQLAMGGAFPPPAFGGAELNWGFHQQPTQAAQAPPEPTPYPDYGVAGYEDDGSRGVRRELGWNARGGRGRGRGRGSGDGGFSRKRKPCSFFAAGRCKFGDSCDFSHEPLY